MENEAEKKSRIMRRLLWVARISAVLLVAFSLLMVIGYSVNPQGPAPDSMEKIQLAFFPIGMTVGYLLALRWELVGGGLSLACLAIFLVLIGQPAMVVVVGILAIPGVLFVSYGLYRRDVSRLSRAD